MTTDSNYLHARLPSIDKLLSNAALRETVTLHGHACVRDEARALLAGLREALGNGDESAVESVLSDHVVDDLCRRLRRQLKSGASQPFKPVFNLTGTVIHTNLGRSVLPEVALIALQEAAQHPVDLEFDLETGKRGERETHLEDLLCRLTGAEAATIVNNNAAAVLLVLQSLAVGREVILSRGEMIEIGAAFRIPDVMTNAGSVLREVGTSNCTHLRDYAHAIGDQTGLLMQVHTSNYAVQGFTASVSGAELAELAHAHDLPFVCDLGSGTLLDLSKYGLPREPTVADVLRQGADVVTFSGDKLLGGPQAGLIVGSKALIERIRKHPLKRALRVDKLTMAAMTAVLRLYQTPATLPDKLPVLRDLTRPLIEIQACAERLLPALESAFQGVADVSLQECHSQIGSGALPMETMRSMAICVRPRVAGGEDTALQELALRFRRLPMPVVGRVNDGALLLDLRCLWDEKAFCAQLAELALMKQSFLT